MPKSTDAGRDELVEWGGEVVRVTAFNHHKRAGILSKRKPTVWRVWSTGRSSMLLGEGPTKADAFWDVLVRQTGVRGWVRWNDQLWDRRPPGFRAPR